jgi:hypothetical protein
MPTEVYFKRAQLQEISGPTSDSTVLLQKGRARRGSPTANSLPAAAQAPTRLLLHLQFEFRRDKV